MQNVLLCKPRMNPVSQGCGHPWPSGDKGSEKLATEVFYRQPATRHMHWKFSMTVESSISNEVQHSSLHVVVMLDEIDFRGRRRLFQLPIWLVGQLFLFPTGPWPAAPALALLMAKWSILVYSSCSAWKNNNDSTWTHVLTLMQLTWTNRRGSGQGKLCFWIYILISEEALSWTGSSDFKVMTKLLFQLSSSYWLARVRATILFRFTMKGFWSEFFICRWTLSKKDKRKNHFQSNRDHQK